MDSDRESERLFSLRLSQVMEDIGVNRRMIEWRRNTFLRIETFSTICSILKYIPLTDYVFGSQTEATTTFWMESDHDTLHSDESVHVILHLNKWQKGKPNLLVLRDELTPPQHCYLQRLRGDVPLPAVKTEGPDDVLIGDGRVLVANTWVEWHKAYSSGWFKITQHGPSITVNEEADNVYAYQCAELPEECQFMFHRPRPGHWPSTGIMERAREAGVFFVPQSYRESPPPKSCEHEAFI
ncbi:uncharacterized protein LOC128246244 [Mya arenaria]|uniref:uncharacterized protein LOC128246244 n=1 Tax=Mya arenaria TaxID=6604 RepID=UPI0022E07F5A|nr:uncharacterized protein LOC128246244 [Mya arenaria]